MSKIVSLVVGPHVAPIVEDTNLTMCQASLNDGDADVSILVRYIDPVFGEEEDDDGECCKEGCACDADSEDDDDAAEDAEDGADDPRGDAGSSSDSSSSSSNNGSSSSSGCSDEDAPDEPFVLCRLNKYQPCVSLCAPLTGTYELSMVVNRADSAEGTPSVTLVGELCDDDDLESDSDVFEGDSEEDCDEECEDADRIDDDDATALLARQMAMMTAGGSRSTSTGGETTDSSNAVEDVQHRVEELSSSDEAAAAVEKAPKGGHKPHMRLPVKRARVEEAPSSSEPTKAEKKHAAAGAPEGSKRAAVLQQKELPSGVRYEVLSKGDGTKMAAPGRRLQVQYEGRLASNGRKFDSGTLEFRVGSGDMIPGFDAGARNMLVREKRRVFVPSRLAYGRKGAGGIPPNSDLIFEITAKNIR